MALSTLRYDLAFSSSSPNLSSHLTSHHNFNNSNNSTKLKRKRAANDSSGFRPRPQKLTNNQLSRYFTSLTSAGEVGPVADEAADGNGDILNGDVGYIEHGIASSKQMAARPSYGNTKGKGKGKEDPSSRPNDDRDHGNVNDDSRGSGAGGGSGRDEDGDDENDDGGASKDNIMAEVAPIHRYKQLSDEQLARYRAAPLGSKRSVFKAQMTALKESDVRDASSQTASNKRRLRASSLELPDFQQEERTAWGNTERWR